MTLLRSLIILALAVSAHGVAKVSSTAELKRLARLPKIQLAPPLKFDRQAGFLIFPDSSRLASELAKIQKDLKDRGGAPAPEKLARLGNIYDQLGNHGLAVRFYRRAIDEYRRKSEIDPSNPLLLSALGRVLALAGNFSEALPSLQRAVTLAPEKSEPWLALGIYYRERLWRIIASESAIYGNISFLDALNEFLVIGADPAELEEAGQYLAQGRDCFEKAAALDPKDATVFAERGSFRAFASVLRTAFSSVRNDLPLRQPLRHSLLPAEAVADFRRAAELDPEDPSRLALAAFLPLFAGLYAQHLPESILWQARATFIPPEGDRSISWAVSRLQSLALSENKELAAGAAEMLGCVQLLVFHDSRGGLKSLRAALAADPERERSWDLVTLELNRRDEFSSLIEHCSDRVITSPSVRNYLFLAKAFERLGDYTKAEWITLTALAASQNDFYANLALANLLLKRADHHGFLGRVKDCLTKAERNMGPNPTAQNHLDLALTRALYLALSEQPDEARELLKKTERNAGPNPEITAALQAIGY